MNVLIIGPGSGSNGGIYSVIDRIHKRNPIQGIKYDYIETFNGGGYLYKLRSMLVAYFIFFTKLFKVDLLHIHLSLRTSFIRKIFFIVNGLLFGKKIIIHLHSPDMNVKLFGRLVVFIFRLADAIIVISPLWKKFLIDNFNIESYVVSNPGDDYLLDDGVKENIVLYVGKLEKRKGYDILLRAINKIKKTNFTFILAGDGEVQEARNYIISNGLENVTVTGWLKDTELRALYRRAKIFVLPSYAEGLPVALIDAFAAKCACITTPVGGIPDICNLQNSILVSPGSSDELTLAIEKLLNNNHLIDNMSTHSRDFYMKNLSVINAVDSLRFIYGKI